jgi:hypothetical protein
MSEITKCAGCGAEFNSYDKLMDHVAEEHNSNCQICSAELSSKEELLEHNKIKHGMKM